MRRYKNALLLAVLSAVLAAHLALAAAAPAWAQYVPGPKLTIINKSDYPASQIYLVFLTLARSGDKYHRILWQHEEFLPLFPVIDPADNTKDINGIFYAEYSATLDKLARDANGTGVMPKQNLYIYTDISKAVDDLKAKRIDAVWLDLKPAQSFADAGGVKVLVQDLNKQLVAVGLMRGSTALRDKINEALAQLEDDGTLGKLQEQYLGLKPDEVIPPPPLPTPVPQQPTPPPPACLDGAQWVADLSFDDKNMTAPPVLNPGQPFTKGWRMRNSGTCTWTTGYALAYTSGNVPAAQMGGQPIPVTRDVRPGETFDFQVNLIAPVAPGTVVAGVLVRGGMQAREARSRAQLIIAAMEGALILARIRRSARPILDVAKLI